jgi:hypothetical protein
MEEKGAQALVQCAEGALCLAILLAGIRTGEAYDSTTFREERAQGTVVKLSAIISLQS